jgi:HEAT repeat protein
LPFASGFSPPATAAAWGAIASIAATLTLLLYTVELRVHRRLRERRRARITAFWRTVIADAMTGRVEPDAAPRLPRQERAEVLRLWNYTRSMIEGAAADRLVALADRLGLRDVARKQAEHGTLNARLTAMQALGFLRDAESFAALLAATNDENTLVSLTAAEALTEIDPARAVQALIPKLTARRDWPRTHVFRMLERAGSALVSEPLYRAIRAASDEDATYLLQYAVLAEYDVRDAMATELLASRQNAELTAAALKVASGFEAIPRLDELLAHPAWYVRMQAAAVLGRAGRAHDAGRLEKLLGDAEWWVRYRAAKALVALPSLAEAGLEELRARLHDPYARDALQQAMAEAGLR